MRLRTILINLILAASVSCAQLTSIQTHRAPAEVNLSNLSSITWDKIPTSQQDELKNVYNNMAKFMLEGAFKSDDEKIALFKRSESYLARVLPVIHDNIEKIRNGQVDKVISFPKTPQWTLKSEIAFIEETTQHYPESKLLPYMSVFRDIFSTNRESLINYVTTGNKQWDQEVRLLFGSLSEAQSDDDKILAIMNQSQKYANDGIDKIKQAARTLAESPQINFEQPFWERLVREFILDYYQNSEIDTFKNILSDIMVLGRTPEDMEVARILFRNSGPGLGKTLQQIGREARMGPELAELMSQLESEGKPVPFHIAKQIIEEESAGRVFTSIDPKPIGTGTVAQVHKANMLYENEEVEVAVRFLKPEIEERAQYDLEKLKIVFDRIEQAPNVDDITPPDLSRVHKTLENFLKSELNIADTITKHMQAEEVYTKSIKVKTGQGHSLIDFEVPRYYESESGRASNIIVTDFIGGGEKFSQITDSDIKKVIAKQTVKIWAEEALFRSGYTHADLHEGNFKIFLYDNGEKIRIVFFDFGMNTNVSLETRRAFILIGAGAAYNDPGLVARALIAFSSDSSTQDVQSLTKIIRDVIAREGTKNQAQWVTWGIQNGFDVPDDLGVFVRGGALVNQMPAIVGQQGIEVKLVEQFAVTYKARNLVNKRFDYPLTITDMARIGAAYIKNSCSNIFKRLGRK